MEENLRALEEVSGRGTALASRGRALADRVSEQQSGRPCAGEKIINVCLLKKAPPARGFFTCPASACARFLRWRHRFFVVSMHHCFPVPRPAWLADRAAVEVQRPKSLRSRRPPSICCP